MSGSGMEASNFELHDAKERTTYIYDKLSRAQGGPRLTMKGESDEEKTWEGKDIHVGEGDHFTVVTICTLPSDRTGRRRLFTLFLPKVILPSETDSQEMSVETFGLDSSDSSFAVDQSATIGQTLHFGEMRELKGKAF